MTNHENPLSPEQLADWAEAWAYTLEQRHELHPESNAPAVPPVQSKQRSPRPINLDLPSGGAAHAPRAH